MVSFSLEKTGRRVRVPTYAVAIVALWAGLVVLSNVLAVQQGHAASSCMFRNVTGVPCGTCGATRAAMDLTHGDVASALWRNPLVLLAELAAVGWLGFRLVSGYSVRMHVAKRARPWLWALTAFIFFANWAHVLAIDGPW